MSDGSKKDSTYYVGIDPGSVNLGFAILKDGVFVESQVLDPSKLGLLATVKSVFSSIPKSSPTVVVIERYVAYKGANTQATEDILMVIGALTYEAMRRGNEVLLFRAIDWKPSICKYLFINNDFKNPSASFDKKFSTAAAEALSGSKFSTTHEADATCLAYKGRIVNELVQSTSSKNG